MEDNTVLIQKSGNSWLLYRHPVDVIQVRSCDRVFSALRDIEKAVDGGKHAAGFVSYEAASGFDAAFSAHQPDGVVPLLWFGLYENVEEISQIPRPEDNGNYSFGDWQSNTSESDYLKSIEQIKRYIHDGDIYQVNYTMKLKALFSGDPYALFHSLSMAQQGRNCAYVNTGMYTVCSSSPELFFAVKGSAVKSCPMKGTASRGLTYEDDCAEMERLHLSVKNRAENIMIVDMIRNDLGRVAESGSVNVSNLFQVERYPTVLQMTSTVRAKTDAPLSDVFKAMFPCASITGAPKVRAMEIIRELEAEPRGVYTGSIGCIAPGHPRKALFNVAIRTVVIDKKSGNAEYGVGGGIVWDSAGDSEYAECLTKTRVLSGCQSEFQLLETMLWTVKDGYYLLEEHIRRIKQSAEYFMIPFSENDLARQLMEKAVGIGSVSARVRLLVDHSGGIAIQVNDLPERPVDVFRLKLAKNPVNSGDRFLYHKTTNRAVYEKARGGQTDCDDVLLYNERGEVTETTIANIVVRINGEFLTPHVNSGLLPGTMRAVLLRSGKIKEAVIHLEDLENCEEIFIINSVRGQIPACIV